MTILDVALRLRLHNGMRPGSQEAKRDLDALRTSALALNGTRGGAALAQDLGRVAAAGTRADASLRRIAADRAGLSATGAAAGRLGNDLSTVAVSGGKADLALRRIAAERSGLSATGTVVGRLGNDLDRAASGATRAGTGLRSLGSERARIAGVAAVAAELARNLERAAATAPRVRVPRPPNTAPWGDRLSDRAAPRRPADRLSTRPMRPMRPDDEVRVRAAEGGGEGALVALGRHAVPALGGVYAVRGAIRGTVGEAISFEKAWAEVIKKVNDAPSKAAMDDLQRTVSKTAIALGLERTGLAALTAEAGAAGIKFADLERYVRLAAKASVGWDMTPRDAAQKLAEIKSAGQFTIAEMDTLADKINALGDNSAAKEADIVEMVQRAAAPAKAAGVDIDTTLAAVTALRSGGMQADVASRFFGAFTSKLATAEGTGKGAKKIADAFEMLGLSVKTVTEGMKRDAAGTMIDILDRLGKHAEPAKVAKEIMGAEWWDEFARFGQSLPEFRKQLDFLKNPANFNASLAGNLNIQLATTANHLERLKALTGDVGDRMGRWALPGINSAIEDAIKQMDELDRRRALRKEGNDGGRDWIDFAKSRSLLSFIDPGTQQSTVDGMIADGAKWLYRNGLDAVIGELPTVDPARAASRAGMTKAADAAEAAAKAREEADLLETRAKGADDEGTRSGLLAQARQARARAETHDADSRDITHRAGPAAARDMTDVEFGEAAARKSIEISRQIQAFEAALAAGKQPNVRLPGTGVVMSRQGADAELAELRKRLAAMTAGPDKISSVPEPNFDLQGPAATTGLRIGRPAGTQTFPLADDIARAKGDLPSLVDGLRQAAEQAARIRLPAPGDPDMARLRAERGPIVVPRQPTPSFGLSGPVKPVAGALTRTGGASVFPLAADLTKARCDLQPLIIGVRQAIDEVGRLRTDLAQDLSAPAAESMRTYTAALKAGTSEAIATVTAAVGRIKAQLSFRASPTITPTITPRPAEPIQVRGGGAPSRRPDDGGAAPRLQTAGLRQGGGVTITGPVHVHGVLDLASLETGIRREADRRARDSRDAGLHDLGATV